MRELVFGVYFCFKNHDKNPKIMNSMKKITALLLLFVGMSAISQTDSYKMMTYNIRYDNPGDGENMWSKRKAFLSDQIAYNAPDIFGIQEGLYHQVQYLDSVFCGLCLSRRWT